MTPRRCGADTRECRRLGTHSGIVEGESGGSSMRFYRTLIRKADERFDRHLTRLAKEGGS